MSKIWTINVLVDTNFLYKLSKEKGHGTGTWEHPVGKNKRFKDHVFLVGSNTKDDTIVTGNDNNFKIPVAPGDQIRWLCTPMNPMMYPNTENKMNLSVCLYGFEKKSDWSKHLENPVKKSFDYARLSLAQKHFDQHNHPPKNDLLYNGEIRKFITTIGVPQTKVKSLPRHHSNEYTLKYHLKLILFRVRPIVNIKGDFEFEILNHIMIDPQFTITNPKI